MLALTDCISELQDVREELVCCKEETKILSKIAGSSEDSGVSPLLISWMDTLCSESSEIMHSK